MPLYNSKAGLLPCSRSERQQNRCKTGGAKYLCTCLGKVNDSDGGRGGGRPPSQNKMSTTQVADAPLWFLGKKRFCTSHLDSKRLHDERTRLS